MGTKHRGAAVTQEPAPGEPSTAIAAGERSKEFEAMLAMISRRFVEAPLGEMDAAIHEALAAVTAFAGGERSHIYLLDGDRGIMNEISRWPDDERFPEDDDLRSIPRTALPFYSEEVFARRHVVFSRLDEFPEAATLDRAFLIDHKVRSALTMPLTAAGETIGTLTLTTLTHERTWHDDDIAMLRVAADVIAPALIRRKSEREQQASIHLQRLVTSLVSEFMNLPADSLNDGLMRALETIARYVDCDRSALYILDETGEAADLYRGWWAEDAEPVVSDYQRIVATQESPYGVWIHSDAPHLILNAAAIEQLRPDAVRTIRRTGLGTVANLPLVIGGRRIGWFGVGATMPRVSWNPGELHSLSIAANALANMYSRHQSELEQRRQQRFADTLSELAADFIKRPLAEFRTGIEEIVDRFGRFAGSDRAAVLLIDETDQTASTYHEWVATGEPAPIRNFPVTGAPWFYEQLKAAQGPWLMYVEDFPPSDALAAAALEAINVRTLLNCPIADGQHLYGYASIGYPRARYRPLAGTEQVLAMAAGIIANALSREQLERRAIDHRDALSHALRLGSLGQLATGIAHELNQPLTAIVNYSRAGVRWLESENYNREALAEILDRVSEEGIRAGDIIHHLRNHVKAGPRARGAASVREIVEKASSLLAGTARDHDVTIFTSFEGSLPFVHAEPTEIEQVVINIVQNAIDSIDSARSDRREIAINARRNHSFVEVEIADTGPGFGSIDADRLFDQFYTTKPGGLGLGLSISRSLIEGNGGRMNAVSTPLGASIRFALPVAGSRSAASNGGA